ncbi:hypothetical protein L6164_002670 [Bauhinia variegata]|uniref:Uncharacterized protein n=1 Tax=Bauhinia variegata TaxID=167791 RepID=A0ACB9PYD2_BAUVA|nr:hypothetical protein L6164_002670 [Bauhinia variegata]
MIWHPCLSLLIVVLALLLNPGSSHRSCKKHTCGPDGPLIQFPFYLIDAHATSSDYPAGFGVYCTDINKTMLELPAFSSPVNLSIETIDYEDQSIDVTDPEGCLPRQFLKINKSSIFHSHYKVDTSTSATFFNCSYSSQDQAYCTIRVLSSSDDVAITGVESCSKMFDATYISEYTTALRLEWSKPNSSHVEIECPNSRFRSTTLTAAGGIIGSVIVIIALFYIYYKFKTKGEDQARVGKFLEDYRSQRPTRFSYADIKRITNGLKSKLGEGAHGVVYKGKLSEKIVVAVKILNNTESDGNEFINEVGTMGKIHHVNVVRLLGFCAYGVHRALIYDFFPHGSLQNFISPPDNKQTFLGWEKLEQIAFGVAKGIECLHQGCDQQIRHFDINPHNVLLDDDFTPKIIDFGLAKLCSRNQSTVSMTAARGTLGYIASEIFSRNFGHVSYKSDIYSYGMLLLEMVGERKKISKSHETEILYPEWIHNLIEGRGDICIRIEDEGDIKIVKKLATVGLWCIQWHSINRPSIRNVLQMLEGEGDKLKVPPNPFDSTTSTSSSAIIPARHLGLELEAIQELE